MSLLNVINRPPYYFIAVVLVIFLLSGLVYWNNTEEVNSPQTGYSEGGIPSNPAPEPTAEPSSGEKVAAVDVLVEKLRRRLETEPDDVRGWVLLAKSYHHLQRWQEASEAFEKAKALGYEDEPQPLPNPATIDQRLYSPPINSLLSQSIEQAIIEKSQTSLSVSAKESTDEFKGFKLKLRLAPALIGQLAPESLVFIFVRSADNSAGATNKAPLAAIKKQVRDLPLEIILDNSMAMMPGRTISSVQQVIVGARVSTSGNPIKQDGDLEQLSEPVPSNYEETVELIISH